jgi:DNA invertase Pin-like site-specific DNA recombinase
MMRAGLYTRTSAADLGVTASDLMKELRRYVTEVRGWDVAVELVDRSPGVTGRREGLAALVTAVRSREVDVVVTTSLAKLCRSLSHVLDMADLLEARSDAGLQEVALVALVDMVDTTTPDGRVRWRDAVELFRRVRRSHLSEGVKVARIRSAVKGVDDNWGRPAAEINPLELAGYWHGSATQRPLSIKEISAKLGYAEGTIRKRVRELLEGGKLRQDVRSRHLSAAGGFRKGGRPIRSRIDLDVLAARWHAGDSLLSLRKFFRCGGERLAARLRELREAGRLDDGRRKANADKRRLQ